MGFLVGEGGYEAIRNNGWIVRDCLGAEEGRGSYDDVRPSSSGGIAKFAGLVCLICISSITRKSMSLSTFRASFINKRGAIKHWTLTLNP